MRLSQYVAVEKRGEEGERGEGEKKHEHLNDANASVQRAISVKARSSDLAESICERKRARKARDKHK